MEAELREVVSWGELPGVFQVESNCTGITLWRWDETTKCALCQPHWTIIDLETSDWKRPTVEVEKGIWHNQAGGTKTINEQWEIQINKGVQFTWITTGLSHGLAETLDFEKVPKII